MGTHARGPSIIKGTGQTLNDWIKDHPESVGELTVDLCHVQYIVRIKAFNCSINQETWPYE